MTRIDRIGVVVITAVMALPLPITVLTIRPHATVPPHASAGR